jgi:putative ABC transport system ATP-binding protein
MIEAIDIGLKYNTSGVEVQSLQHVNLSVAKGEYLAVSGPAGSGKSSLLSILGLLTVPSQGQLQFLERETVNLSERQRLSLRRGAIGYLQADAMLIDSLTVGENVALPLNYLKFKHKDIKQRVVKSLEGVNLLHRQDSFPSQLSPYHRQLVSFARALVIEPLMVIADEPCNRLNSSEGDELLHLIEKSNNSGVTWIVGTSSVQVAQRAERIIQLFDGHLIGDKLPEKGW